MSGSDWDANMQALHDQFLREAQFRAFSEEELASSGLGAINSDHLLATSSFAAFGALDLVPQSVDSVLTGLLDDDGAGSLSGAFGSSSGGSISSSGMFGGASAMPSFTSSMWGSPDPAAASSSLFANAGAASQQQYSSAAPDSASAFDSGASEADALLSDPQLLAAVAAAAASGSDVVLPDGTTLPADAVLQLLSALAAGTLGSGSGSGDFSGAHSAGDAGVESGATAVSMDELEKKLAAAHLADGSSQSQTSAQQLQQASAAASSGLQPATSEAPSQQQQYQPRLRIPLPRTARFALMSTHDLEFVLRSQLMQLSSKNPMNDDFYFQVMNARKGGRYRGSGFPLAAATNRVNPFRNADGTPKLPESTLGRLRVFSVRRPKSALDLDSLQPSAADDASSSSSLAAAAASSAPSSGGADSVAVSVAAYVAQPARRGMFAQRSLAFLIEECIRVIMDLEDVDSILISLGAPHASEDAASIAERIRLRHQRHALCARLLDSLDLQSTLEAARFEGNAVNVETGSAQAALAVAYTLADDHLLFKFSRTNKGRLLVYRAIATLPPYEALAPIANLFGKALGLAYPESHIASDSTIGRLLGSIFAQLSLAQVNVCFGAFLSAANRTRFVELLQSRIGCAAVAAFMKKGHQAIFAAPPLTTPSGDLAATPDAEDAAAAAASSAAAAALAAQTAEWTAHRDALMALLRGQWKTLLSTPAPFLPVVVPAAVAAAAGATAAGAVPKSGAAKKVDKPNVQSHADFPTLAVPASTAAAAASDAATPGAPSAATAAASVAPAAAKATASWVPALWPVASQTDAMIACGIARGELPFLAPLDGVWEMAAALLAHATPAQLDAVRDEVGEILKSSCLLHAAVGYIATLLFPDFVPPPMPAPAVTAAAAVARASNPVAPLLAAQMRNGAPMGGAPPMPAPGQIFMTPRGPAMMTPNGPIPAPLHMLPPQMRAAMATMAPPPMPAPVQIFMTQRGPALMTPNGPVPAPPHMLPPHMRAVAGAPGGAVPPPMPMPAPGQIFMTPRGPALMTPNGPIPAPPHMLASPLPAAAAPGAVAVANASRPVPAVTAAAAAANAKPTMAMRLAAQQQAQPAVAAAKNAGNNSQQSQPPKQAPQQQQPKEQQQPKQQQQQASSQPGRGGRSGSARGGRSSAATAKPAAPAQ